MSAPPAERTLLGALVLVQVLFGALAVAAKFVLPHVDPLALALFRLGAGAAVLVTLERLVVRSALPPVRDLATFALFALLGVVLNQGLFLMGLERTSASTGVLLVATIPAFTLLVAVVMGHERASPLKVGGLLVSFGGVLLLVAGGLELGRAALVGNVLIVLNALSYSIYLVVSRPVLQRVDGLTLLAWVFAFGFLEMALVAAPAALRVDWGGLDAVAWGAFAFILIGPTIVTYGLNVWVLRHLPASRVASFVYLQPLVGVLLAVVILQEPFTGRDGAAALLILAGVWLANRVRPSPRAATGTGR